MGTRQSRCCITTARTGNRISKTVDGVTTDYYYIDGKLLGLKKGQDTLLFLYDETGTAYGFLRNGTPFYYAFNLQGDVIAIYNETGMEMVTYSYDVWGNHTCIIDNYYMGLANLNPLRYRGYFYDEETGFYYLQSRYYDPEVGRFISSDGYVSTGQGVLGYNQFAYCLNNPVRYIGLDGEAATEAILGWLGLANSWNPVGWTILGVAGVFIIIWAISQSDIWQNGYVGGRQDAISDSLTSAKQRVRSAAISASIAASVLKTRVKI